jgi:hypothetical protein
MTELVHERDPDAEHPPERVDEGGQGSDEDDDAEGGKREIGGSSRRLESAQDLLEP